MILQVERLAEPQQEPQDNEACRTETLAAELGAHVAELGVAVGRG